MIRAAIDHLVVTAPSLDAGAEYVRRELGASLQPGGRHVRMGTHNALLKLGESTYLEVLAVDPAARPPSYARWFGLDDMRPGSAPRLAAWVACVEDVHAAAAALPGLGDVMTMSRGALTWLITIPSDGSLSVGGVMPVLIQWIDGPHPAQSLENAGCTLDALRGVQTDMSRITRALGKFDLDDRWSLAPAEPGQQPGLVATIQTPGGPRQLGAYDAPGK